MAIVVVLSNIWWPVSMLCSDNADCVICFSLTSRSLFFHTHINHSSSFSNVYFSTGDILYTPVELTMSGGWSLGFFKICPIFLEGKRFKCRTYSISCPIPVIPFIYGRMEKIFLPVLSCDDCVGVHWITVFADLFISCLSCPFFCKACFRWLSSVRKCSLSEMESSMYKWIDSWLLLCWVMM